MNPFVKKPKSFGQKVGNFLSGCVSTLGSMATVSEASKVATALEGQGMKLVSHSSGEYVFKSPIYGITAVIKYTL